MGSESCEEPSKGGLQLEVFVRGIEGWAIVYGFDDVG